MLKQARVMIKGDVIGVGFRAWTAIQAKELGIRGWVRNVYDPEEGVEALLQAEEGVLDKMISRLREGPPAGQVDDIEVSFEIPTEELASFEIKR